MRGKFLILAVALLATLVFAGGCGKKDDNGMAEGADKILVQSREWDQDQSQPTALEQEQPDQSQESHNNVSSAEIEQTADDILAQTEEEQRLSDGETADEDAIKNDDNELNNLTQTYDEKEF